MKRLLIIAAVSLMGSAAFAQSSSTGMISYGLKAGVNLPKYHFSNGGGSSETNSTTNFNVTLYMEAPLVPGLAIQPGISLQGKGGETSSSTTEVKQNTLWIEVPVNLVAKIPAGPAVHLYVGAGPYAAFGLSGQTKTTFANTTTKTDVSFGNSTNDDLKGTDFGVNLIGGLQMNRGLSLGAGYGIGLTDLKPNSNTTNGKTTNRVLSFTVGVAL